MLAVMHEGREDGACGVGWCGRTHFPTNFTLLSAKSRCPCGHYGDATRACTYPEAAVLRHLERRSDPLLDGIVLHGEVTRVEYEKLAGDGLSEPSMQMR
jgi:magnesium chelatase family protein